LTAFLSEIDAGSHEQNTPIQGNRALVLIQLETGL